MSTKDIKVLKQFIQQYEVWDLSKYTHPKQFNLIKDEKTHIVVLAGRRGGKSEAAGFKLLHTAKNTSGVSCLYICASRSSAKRTLWARIIDLNNKFSFNANINYTELTLTLPNGSIIYFCGADTEREQQKLRGIPKVKLAIIDESQRFNQSQLRDLVDNIVGGPALADVAGQIWLVGTPPPTKSGVMWKCMNSTEWSKHNFSIHDNCFLPQIIAGKTADQIIDEDLKKTGNNRESTYYIREWLGKFAEDTDARVLKYSEKRNSYIDLPDNESSERLDTYVFGCDIGYNDGDAIAVLGWGEAGIVYLVEEDIVHGQIISQLAEKLKIFYDKYGPIKILVDSGGGGLKTLTELQFILDLPLEPARKPSVKQQVQIVNDFLLTGRLLARADSRFAEDTTKEAWVDKVIGGKISDAFHSDIIPAVRYGLIGAVPYIPVIAPPPEPPKPIQTQLREKAFARAGRVHLEEVPEEEEGSSNWDNADNWDNS